MIGLALLGTAPPLAEMALATKAVVAMLVSLSPTVGVGAVGVPVRSGEAQASTHVASFLPYTLVSSGASGTDPPLARTERGTSE